MKVALLSANIGRIDPDLQGEHTEQEMPKGWEFSRYYFTEENLPHRSLAFRPRLQAKIPKMLGWKLVPGMDCYIWLDAAFAMSRPDTVKWMVDQLGSAGIAAFAHPYRRSVRSEFNFMRMQMAHGDGYLIERYTGEPIDEQVYEYLQDVRWNDDSLWMMGAFVYRNTEAMRAVLKEWYGHCCVWSVQDQLSFPYITSVRECRVVTLPGNGLCNPYLKYHCIH